MSIYSELAAALGRPAELAEYAEKIEAVIEELTGRVPAAQASPAAEDPTSAADGTAPAAATAS